MMHSASALQLLPRPDWVVNPHVSCESGEGSVMLRKMTWTVHRLRISAIEHWDEPKHPFGACRLGRTKGGNTRLRRPQQAVQCLCSLA